MQWCGKTYSFRTHSPCDESLTCVLSAIVFLRLARVDFLLPIVVFRVEL